MQATQATGIKQKLIGYLRTIVEQPPYPKNRAVPSPDTHIANDIKTNVRPPSQTKKPRAITQPIYCPNTAKNALISVWENYDETLLDNLYCAYKHAISTGFIAPTKRDGRKYLHRQIVSRHYADVNAQTVDAILVLFNIHLEQLGILQVNPSYTGNPPYPRYIRGNP